MESENILTYGKGCILNHAVRAVILIRILLILLESFDCSTGRDHSIEQLLLGILSKY